MSDATNSETPITPAYIHHIYYRAKRFEQMKQFYKLVFHCRPLFENELFSWLTFDQEHHRIALQNAPMADDQTMADEGLDHVGYQYSGPRELFATFERLEAEGILPYWCTNHGGTTSFYYKDPDGNGLELQYDNYETMDELMEWFHGGDFEKNPIGVDVDPHRLIAAHRGGLGRVELHLASRCGDYLPNDLSLENPAKPFPDDMDVYMGSIRAASSRA